MKKVWLVRLDKMGDLVLTLPVDQVFNFENAKVTWVIQKSWKTIVELSQPKRNYVTVANVQEFSQLLAAEKPDIVVLFQAPAWAYKQIFLKRIPVRCGRKSSWLSFFTLNYGVRQKRHLSQKSELIYNFDLLTPLEKKFPTIFIPSWSDLEKNGFENAQALQLEASQNRNLLERFSLKSKSYIVIHPGMAGSALNWSIENYVSLIEDLSKKNQVVVTGTTTDAKWTSPLIKLFDEQKALSLVNRVDLEELIFILSRAKAVVAPSTGVLHLAASLGVRAVGLYSPVMAHHPRRWGALGKDVQILAPENSMSEITVEQVLEKIFA